MNFFLLWVFLGFPALMLSADDRPTECCLYTGTLFMLSLKWFTSLYAIFASAPLCGYLPLLYSFSKILEI